MREEMINIAKPIINHIACFFTKYKLSPYRVSAYAVPALNTISVPYSVIKNKKMQKSLSMLFVGLWNIERGFLLIRRKEKKDDLVVLWLDVIIGYL